MRQMGKKGLRLGVILVLLVLLDLFSPISGSAKAQDQLFNGDVINAIRVEGNQRIEPETIVNYMQLSDGDRFDPAKIDQALKSLFATGFFADVNITRDGADLLITVVENPIINRLAFEGNNKLEDETLLAELQLRPRVVYTLAKARADIKRILDLYRRSGRFAATVEPKVIKLDQNRVDLVFEINEGSLTAIERIDFVGNKAFSDNELRDEIFTKESAFYRFLSTSDNYDPDRLNADKDNLRKFYLSEGYADFSVSSAVAELSPDREAFFVTFTINEGERYKFGNVEIKTTLKNLDVEGLTGKLDTKTGDWYDASLVEVNVTDLSEAVGNLGYAFVEVRPRTSGGEEPNTLDIVYDINEGPKVYVERIEITGNVRTQDKVIRREFRFAEGDAFSVAKLKRTDERLKNLNFFETIEIRPTPSESPDKTVVKVKVAERSTGDLKFGAGFSTQDGPLGNLELQERNLLGKGQNLRANVRISGRRSGADISFTDPYFLDQDLVAGADIFHTRFQRRESNFRQNSSGFGLRTGFAVSEFLDAGINYRFSYDDLGGISSNTSRAVRIENGDLIRSTIGYNLSYDRRDSRLDPRDGHFVNVGNDFIGAGGSVYNLRSSAGAGIFHPLNRSKEWTVGATTDVGYIFSLNDDPVFVSDAFLLGGNDLRGFTTAGIGPFDEVTDDRIGGKFRWSGTVQSSFPLGLPEEYQIRGRLFSDFGILTGTDFEDFAGTIIFDDPSLRLSLGGGVTWNSPFGPLGIDLAYPLLKESYDRREIFRFSVGTSF